jgi:hypothetical protein
MPTRTRASLLFDLARLVNDSAATADVVRTWNLDLSIGKITINREEAIWIRDRFSFDFVAPDFVFVAGDLDSVAPDLDFRPL